MYSDVAFAKHIYFPLFSIVEIDMTKNGVFQQTSKQCLTGVCSILQPVIILFSPPTVLSAQPSPKQSSWNGKLISV